MRSRKRGVPGRSQGYGYGTRPHIHAQCKCTRLHVRRSLVPRPLPAFSMLHAEKREGLVSKITCMMSFVVLSFVRRQQQPHNDVCTSIALARPHSYSHALPASIVAALPNPATVANGIRGSERLTLRTTKSVNVSLQI